MIAPLQLDLSEQDLRCVLQIISTHVPDRPVYVFGQARRRSDLDLAIGGATPLSLHQRDLLNDDFSESDLSIKVDILDLNAITPEFHSRIKRDFVVLQGSSILDEVVAR